MVKKRDFLWSSVVDGVTIAVIVVAVVAVSVVVVVGVVVVQKPEFRNVRRFIKME